MVGVHGPQDHRIGHEFHLGQKPKLGGRYADNHTHLHIVFCRSIIYPCLVFFFLLLVQFYFCFPKHKKTKNISVVSLWFFVFGLLNLLVSLLFENPKIFYFLCFVLAFQKSKTQKYFVFFFGFVKFVAEFSGPWLLHWSLVIILYYSSHKGRAIMTIYTA